MKKFSLAIAAAATIAALSAAPASAESTVTEQQYKLSKILNKSQTVSPRFQTRATTFTNRGATSQKRYLNRHDAALARLLKHRQPRGR